MHIFTIETSSFWSPYQGASRLAPSLISETQTITKCKAEIKNREGRVTKYYAKDASCKYLYPSGVYSGQERF